MNPNELKPGDRIMIPAREATVIKVEPQNYTGNYPAHVAYDDDEYEWVHRKSLSHAHFITPDKPVADKWEPSYGSKIEWTHGSLWSEGIWVGKSVIGKLNMIEVQDTVHSILLVDDARIRPFPSAPTMEEELRMIVNNSNFISQIVLEERILAWHTKHQPSIPSVSEFAKYYSTETDGTLSSCMKQAYAHFGIDKIARDK